VRIGFGGYGARQEAFLLQTETVLLKESEIFLLRKERLVFPLGIWILLGITELGVFLGDAFKAEEPARDAAEFLNRLLRFTLREVLERIDADHDIHRLIGAGEVRHRAKAQVLPHRRSANAPAGEIDAIRAEPTLAEHFDNAAKCAANIEYSPVGFWMNFPEDARDNFSCHITVASPVFVVLLLVVLLIEFTSTAYGAINFLLRGKYFHCAEERCCTERCPPYMMPSITMLSSGKESFLPVERIFCRMPW